MTEQSRIAELEQQVAKLEQQVAKLERQVEEERECGQMAVTLVTESFERALEDSRVQARLAEARR